MTPVPSVARGPAGPYVLQGWELGGGNNIGCMMDYTPFHQTPVEAFTGLLEKEEWNGFFQEWNVLSRIFERGILLIRNHKIYSDQRGCLVRLIVVTRRKFRVQKQNTVCQSLRQRFLNLGYCISQYRPGCASVINNPQILAT